MIYDIAVVGGGASGLFAAIIAKKLNRNLNIVVLEALERVGKKLIITGNGQCNITNKFIKPEFYHSENLKQAMQILNKFTVNDTVAAFNKMGVKIVFEPDGRAYPASYQAGSVVDALRFSADELGIKTITDFCVEGFCGKKPYTVKGNKGEVKAANIIFAAGLLSGGAKTGSTGNILRIFKEKGYGISKLTPSIVQLKTETDIVRQLKGIKINGTAKLINNEKTVKYKNGEILFTDYGLSGPAVMGISREASRLNGENKISIDIMPQITAHELLNLLKERKCDLSARLSDNYLTGLINKKLGQVLLKKAGIPFNIPVSDISDGDIKNLCNIIKSFDFKITGTTGFNNSQVTAGGIKLTDVTDTLESKRSKGIYFIGEILDVDGDCGGYNLQWAWSSAAVAAQSIAGA